MSRKLEQKKKTRERKVHKKILKKRFEVRKEVREEKADALLRRKAVKEAIAADQAAVAAATKEEVIKSKLAENLKILEALESDFIKEMESKKEMGLQLEAEGYKSPEQKVEAIKSKIRVAMDKYSYQQTPIVDSLIEEKVV